MDITGLVLCGGKSIRMGSDKGLLFKDGKTWARTMSDKLAQLNIPSKISINTSQLIDYERVFNAHELISDQVEIAGPLGGILSAHCQYPETNWLILACDMIDMDEQTLTRILKTTDENPGKDFYAYRNETHYEPFGGIYTSMGLKKVYNLSIEKILPSLSLQYVLNRFETYPVLSKTIEAAFNNYNSL